MPGARHDPARDAARRGRGQGRSGVGRTPDAVALGPQAPQHRFPVQSDRNPVSAGHRRRGSRPDVRKDYRHRGSRRSLPRRRSRLHVGWRRGDERRGILGVAELRLHAEAAGRHPGRRQRLRDFSAGRSADPRRRHLEDRRVISRSPGPEHRRHRLHRQLRSDVRGGRVRPRAQRARAGARQGDPALLALALGRRKAVQDGGGTRRRSDARSDCAARLLPDVGRHRHARAAPADPARGRGRGERGGRSGDWRRETVP